jgi:hypothetical protein
MHIAKFLKPDILQAKVGWSFKEGGERETERERERKREREMSV